MKKFIYNLAALALTVAFSSSQLFAAAATGMLRSNGGVSVNGSSVTPITTVFAGDRIETAPKAAGSITVGSSSLMLSGNSSLLFTGQSMDFQCGGATISTKQGMAARFGRMNVKPVKDAARYRVQQSGATLQVAALDGDLELNEGGRNIAVTSGNTASVPYAGCVTQVAKNDSQLPSGNVAATPDPAPQTPTPVDTPGVTKAALFAPTVVAGVALIGILEVKQQQASPSKP